MATLRGAAVLITGASSGIGAAAAVAFARRGARLALCARRLDRLQEVAERCRRAGSPEVVVRKVDVGRGAEARAFVAAALQSFERVDVLVNNAGVGWRGRFEDMPEAAAAQVVTTNLLGAFNATQSVLPAMLAANSGVIVNVASVVALRPLPYSAVYSATKQALAGFAHALRGELSGTGIKVSVVYPGSTDTELFGRRPASGPLVQSAGQVAEIIVRAARRPRRDVVVLPYRLAQLAEPLLGGPMDHLLGEAGRRRDPGLRR